MALVHGYFFLMLSLISWAFCEFNECYDPNLFNFIGLFHEYHDPILLHIASFIKL